MSGGGDRVGLLDRMLPSSLLKRPSFTTFWAKRHRDRNRNSVFQEMSRGSLRLFVLVSAFDRLLPTRIVNGGASTRPAALYRIVALMHFFTESTNLGARGHDVRETVTDRLLPLRPLSLLVHRRREMNAHRGVFTGYWWCQSFVSCAQSISISISGADGETFQYAAPKRRYQNFSMTPTPKNVLLAREKNKPFYKTSKESLTLK